MRRYLFAAIAAAALTAAVPVTSIARSDDGQRHRAEKERRHERTSHRRHDRERARHHRGRHDRIEHFRAHRAEAGGRSEAVGTIQSLSSGNVLTIALNDGSTVRGTVTRHTRVSCRAMDTRVHAADSGRGDDNDAADANDRGDDNGAADANDRGDDNGAADANDRGDDNGAADANDRDDDNGAAEDHGAQSCAMALRTRGTTVREATLRLTRSAAVWDRLDLDA